MSAVGGSVVGAVVGSVAYCRTWLITDLVLCFSVVCFFYVCFIPSPLPFLHFHEVCDVGQYLFLRMKPDLRSRRLSR